MNVILQEQPDPGKSLTVLQPTVPDRKIIKEEWPEPAKNAGGSSEQTDPSLPKMTVAEAAPRKEPSEAIASEAMPLIKPLPQPVLPTPPDITPDTSIFDGSSTAIVGKQNPGSGSGVPGRGIGRGIGNGFGNGIGPGFELEPARWVRKMTYYQLRRYYPKAALRNKVSGEVELICNVKLNRRVRDCFVESETPAGAGFGQASLTASKRFRIFPREIDGEPVDGAPVLITIWYDPEPLAPGEERK
ncbi:MAG: energy transducer TonB [Pseudomonadota bacterium]